MFNFICFRELLETKDQLDIQVVLELRDLEVMQEQVELVGPEDQRESKDLTEIQDTLENR